MSRPRKVRKLRNAREQAAALARAGAHLQLDRQGAHRPRVVPNKEAAGRAGRFE